MSKELVITSNRHETKLAMLEDDQLVEIYFQRANEYSLAGSIHKGRVTRVLPGMQSAFVNIGLERDAFLYVSDFFEEGEDYEGVSISENGRARREDHRERDGDSRGGRDRRGRDRGDRGGDRAPREAREAVQDAVRQPAIRVAIPALSEGIEIAPPAGDSSSGSREDRGRRTRRRRGQRGGLPDSKFVSDPSALADPVEADEADTEEHEAAVFEPAEPVERILLPGESISKYQNAKVLTAEASVAEAPESIDTEQDLEDVEVHVALEDDDIELDLDGRKTVLVDDLEDLDAVPELIGDAEEEADAEEDVDEDEDDGDKAQAAAEAALAAERISRPLIIAPHQEPDFSIDAAMVSEAEAEEEAQDEDRAAAFDMIPREHVTETPESDDSDAEDEATGEETLTAEVRETGDRAPHRSTRRSRRRRGGSRETAPATVTPIAPPAVEPLAAIDGEEIDDEPVAQAAPAAAPVVEMRTERPAGDREPRERRGRDRRGRGDRGDREPRGDRSADRPATDRAPAERSERSHDRESRGTMPNISDLLKEGQEIIVQIAKEPLGQKGARITSHIALPGRYVVYMPTLDHLGVSRKIGTDEERARLKRILQTHREGYSGGFITRTAAEGRSEEDIAADMTYLFNLWQDIRNKAEKRPAPLLLHHDLDLVQRVLRDQINEDFKNIWVDHEELYENVLSFMQRFQPNLVAKVKLYTRPAPIFDAFGITQELEKALRPKVWLKSGGYIVINQTEALVAIDINTGKYVGRQNTRLEDTIVKTNIEAILEIVRQIRLRDLGGIIVVDFIDMDERKNRKKVMDALEEAMRVDRAPYKILQFNDFGLVAITRKRVKQSLERTLCMPCPHCEGAGYIKSVTTVVSEILVEAQKLAKALEDEEVVLRVHPDVAKVFKSTDNQFLEEIETILGRSVLVKGDALIHHEKFDLS